MSQVTVNPEMTMESILTAIPSAQRALFQRYHIGGCSSCGYEPTDTLSKVCKDHNILDVNEVVTFLHQAHELDQNMQVQPTQVQSWVEAGEDFSFIDVRTPDELEKARVESAEPMDYTNSERYMNLPKDRKIVFLCKSGARSLDVAAYFLGHGFSNVYSVREGLEGWRRDVDPSLPTYE